MTVLYPRSIISPAHKLIILPIQKITSLVRTLNKGRACGSDTHVDLMILCHNTVISNQILATGIYPDTWKLANVTNIDKKGWQPAGEK